MGFCVAFRVFGWGGSGFVVLGFSFIVSCSVRFFYVLLLFFNPCLSAFSFSALG